MDILYSIWMFLWNYVITKAPILMAVFVLIGQLVVGTKPIESIANAIKAYIGYAVFSVGTSGISTAFAPIIDAMRNTMGEGRTITYAEMYHGLGFVQEAMEKAGHAAGISASAMIGAFLVSLVLALPGIRKFTKIRTLLVQGHILNNHAWCIAGALFMCVPGLSDMQIIILASVVGGLKFAVLSNLTVEAAQTLTDGAGMCVGHAQMINDWLSFRIGERIEFNAMKKGKEVKTLDNIEFPGWLEVFQDVYLGSFVVTLLFFGIAMILLGKGTMMEFDPTLTEATNYGYYIFITAAKFPLYLCILQTGLRMFIAEMIVAFTGLSEKVLRGTLPGIDVAAFYGFASNPNVITCGFIIGTITMIATTFLVYAVGLPFAIFTAFMSMFFDNASCGMFGHVKGGIKGMTISAILCGVTNIFLGGIGAYLIGYIALGGVPGSNTDFSVLHTYFGLLWKPFGIAGVIISCIGFLLVPQIQYLKNKKTYWLAIEDWEKYKEVYAEVRAEKLAKAQKSA